MINEYYLALTNTAASRTVPGSDYVPAGWQARKLSNEASALQRSLLIDPNSDTTSNWRAIELRKLTDKSDLSSVMVSLDARTGYLLNELLYDMTQYLQPRVAGDEAASQVSVDGSMDTLGYELSSWNINVGATTWQVSGRGGSVDGTHSGSGRVTAVLPGTNDNARVSFPLDSQNTFIVTWASKPSVTIIDTARELAESLAGHVDSVSNQDSRFSPETCRMLRDVVLGKTEAAAKVVAASLLLAGHSLAAPVEE